MAGESDRTTIELPRDQLPSPATPDAAWGIDGRAPNTVLVARAVLATLDGAHTVTGDRIVVGSSPDADLHLDDPAVSRFHLVVQRTPRGFTVEDLHSRNGTFVDGVSIERAYLRDGMVLRAGNTSLAFQARTETTTLATYPGSQFGPLVGASAAMRSTFARLARAADTDATLLLLGETGTGKEYAAAAVHQASRRADGPFLVVDCGALPATLLEAELFGYARGAFTGADHDRQGLFEAAAGGTVFLDEIAELPRELQSRLLRALEQHAIKRLGESTYRAVDVRIIAATHRDLRARVTSGELRADLYFRLAVLEVVMPPLRDRLEDLPMLVDALLARQPAGNLDVQAQLRAPEGLARMARHAWPGNVRELRNHVERCVALGGADDPVRPERARLPGPAPLGVTVTADDEFKTTRDRWLAGFERAYLVDLIDRHRDNMAAAARAAGLDRTYLYRLLWRHGLR